MLRFYSQRYVDMLKEMYEREITLYKAIIHNKDEEISKLKADLEYLRFVSPGSAKGGISLSSLFEEKEDIERFLNEENKTEQRAGISD